jgi:hypothetical protein
MDLDLITVARFTDPATAGLAQSRLEAAGIPSFLADEFTMGLAWHLNVALGGIRLQVAPEHADDVRLLLEEPGLAVETWQDESDAPSAIPVAEDSEEGPRALLARRTVRAGVIGWILTPMLIYSLIIGIRSLAMRGELSVRQRTQLWLVTVLDLVLIVLWARFATSIYGS